MKNTRHLPRGVIGILLFFLCAFAVAMPAYAEQTGDPVSLTINAPLLQKSDNTAVYYPIDIHLFDSSGQEVAVNKSAESLTNEERANGDFGKYTASVAAGSYTYDAYNHETSVKLGGGTIVVAAGQTKQEETLSLYMFGGADGKSNITNPDKVGYTLTITGPDGTTDFPVGDSGLTAVLPAREGADDYAYTYAFVPADSSYWGSSGQLWVYGSNSPDFFSGLNLSDIQQTGFLIAPKTTIQLQVESGASVRIARIVRFYRPMEYISGTVVKTEDGIDTWEFEVPKYSNSHALHYEVRKDGKVTQAKPFDPTKYADGKQVLTVPALKDGSDTQKKDSSQSFFQASILLNGPTSKMVSMDAGDTFDIWASRTWQAVNNIGDNYYVDPDFHYTVVSGDSVSVRDDGRVVASKSGVSVVQVTYDALEYEAIAGSPVDDNGLMVYSAIWPERTGVLVFNVGDSNEANISTGIDLTEYDTVYFAKTVNGESRDGYAEYSFTPTADQPISSVRVQKPLQSSWEDGWESYSAGEDGSYTVKLYEGPNIVEVKAGDSAQYHVVYAAGLDITIENAAITDREYLAVGDTAVVTLGGLTMPMPKLGAVYNPGYPSTTYIEYDADGTTVEGAHCQWQLGTANTVKIELTEKGVLKLTDGKVHSSSIGEVPTEHQRLTKEGMASKYSTYGGGITPTTFNGYLCKLPDIEITVEDAAEKSEVDKLNYITVNAGIYSTAMTAKSGNPFLSAKEKWSVFNRIFGFGNAKYTPTVLTNGQVLPQNLVLWTPATYTYSLLQEKASPIYTRWKNPDGVSTTLRYWSTMEGYTTPTLLKLENKVMAQTEAFASASDIAYLEYICTPDEGVEAYPKTYVVMAHKKDGDSYGKVAYLYGLEASLVDGQDDKSPTDGLLHAVDQDGIDFGYGFLGTETGYTMTVPFSTTQLTLTPTALDEGTTVEVTVDGQKVDNEAASQAIAIEGQYTDVDVTVSVSGDGGVYDTKTYSIRIERRRAAAKVTTKSLPHATVESEEPYSAKLEATGDPDEFIWGLEGELPAGLAFDTQTGTISGTPEAGSGGEYRITATALNAEGAGTRSYTLVVDEAPNVVTESLPTAYVGSAYSASVEVAGYPEASVFVDGLPEGMEFDSETLEISGTPAEAGAYEVTISADSSLGTASRTVELLVCGGAWTRLAGDSRLDTMGRIVDEGFPGDGSCGTILVATAYNYADALSASALAGVLDAPLVTTDGGSLSDQAAERIARLADGEATVYVLGGSGAVSDAALSQIEQIWGVDRVERLAGSDRVGTGLEILEAGDGRWGDACVVADAWGYADALSAGAYASVNAAPVFGAAGGALSDAQVSAIEEGGFSKVVIVGGDAAVDAGRVREQLGSGRQYVVLAGESRLETSLQIVEWECGLDGSREFSPENELSLANLAVANAWDYADALAGVNLSTQLKAPVLLVDESDATSAMVESFVKGSASSIADGRILGGTSAVSSVVEGWLNAAVAPAGTE